MKSSIPTAEDISPSNGLDLDERDALSHFLGKDVSEAGKLFRENFVHYAGDLHFMGASAFAYYFPAFADYFRSADSAGYGDVVNCLIVLLRIRMLRFKFEVRQ